MNKYMLIIIFLFFTTSSYARTAVVYDPISNIRKTPNGKILCKIKRIKKITISSKSNNGWYSTNVCGEKGVIHHTQVVFFSARNIGIVYDPISNIRLNPDGKIICKVKKIAAMTVFPFNNEWYSTDYCGAKGVIHQSQIILISNSKLDERSPNKGGSKAIVYDPISNVRYSPKGKVICRIKDVTEINIFQYNQEWYKTDFCGKIGVIHRSQIKLERKKSQNLASKEKPSSDISNIARVGNDTPVYSYSSRYSSCKNRTTKCLALTWGPDVCSSAFGAYAKNELNFSVNDIIASPTCLVAISKYLDEDYSDTDIALAMLTGVLDESGAQGFKSDAVLDNILGGLSYFASQGIKLSLYNSCMSKCK